MAHTGARVDFQGERAQAGKFRTAWCQVMHDSSRWPIHGHYECGVCGIRYPVPWEEHTPAAVHRFVPLTVPAGKAA